MTTRTLTASAMILIAAVSGCGGDSEPTRYPVQGTITLNGKPYADMKVEFVPDPGNAGLTAGVDHSGPEGNYLITAMGLSGLAPGKYRVIVSPKPEFSSEDPQAQAEEEMRLESMTDAEKRAARGKGKKEKPGGTFDAEVEARPNTLDFDVKAATS